MAPVVGQAMAGRDWERGRKANSSWDMALASLGWLPFAGAFKRGAKKLSTELMSLSALGYRNFKHHFCITPNVSASRQTFNRTNHPRTLPLPWGNLDAELERLRPAEMLAPESLQHTLSESVKVPLRRVPPWHFDLDAAA